MKYLVFPFGKYKGVELKELPSTYIVLALEKFDLPFELENELYNILLCRLDAFMHSVNIISNANNVEEAMNMLVEHSNKYHKE